METAHRRREVSVSGAAVLPPHLLQHASQEHTARRRDDASAEVLFDDRSDARDLASNRFVPLLAEMG